MGMKNMALQLRDDDYQSLQPESDCLRDLMKAHM